MPKCGFRTPSAVRRELSDSHTFSAARRALIRREPRWPGAIRIPGYCGRMTAETATSKGKRLSPEERRSELLQCAVDLALESGLARVTARRVAQRAGVAQGLVTHHFGLDDIETAYDLFGHQRDGVLKVAIRP